MGNRPGGASDRSQQPIELCLADQEKALQRLGRQKCRIKEERRRPGDAQGFVLTIHFSHQIRSNEDAKRHRSPSRVRYPSSQRAASNADELTPGAAFLQICEVVLSRIPIAFCAAALSKA